MWRGQRFNNFCDGRVSRSRRSPASSRMAAICAGVLPSHNTASAIPVRASRFQSKRKSLTKCLGAIERPNHADRRAALQNCDHWRHRSMQRGAPPRARRAPSGKGLHSTTTPPGSDSATQRRSAWQQFPQLALRPLDETQRGCIYGNPGLDAAGQARLSRQVGEIGQAAAPRQSINLILTDACLYERVDNTMMPCRCKAGPKVTQVIGIRSRGDGQIRYRPNAGVEVGFAEKAAINRVCDIVRIGQLLHIERMYVRSSSQNAQHGHAHARLPLRERQETLHVQQSLEFPVERCAMWARTMLSTPPLTAMARAG